MIMLHASLYGSNINDITRNRKVTQVYSSLLRSSVMKTANQNNNLPITMITDNAEADYIHTAEDIYTDDSPI